MNFSVVDPTNGNAPYNILTAAPFTGTDPGTGKPVCANGRRGAPRDRYRVGDERLHELGQRRDAATWGQPISLNPLAVAGCAAGGAAARD